MSKQVAYISTVYFIKAFGAPSKLIMQVFVALLKANHGDVKYMVKQSLDLLAPLLTEESVPHAEYINWTRRILSEDGFS
ncbi:hypothetical protein FD682_22605, partial [Atlantibacter subterranea]